MKSEIELKKIGGSNAIILPKLYCDHIGVSDGDVIILQDDCGTKGKFISFWKKEKSK